ncbi:hypothetical protein HOH45_01540, partial [bacterium]|nr:hypothetical protein [bacterium]
MLSNFFNLNIFFLGIIFITTLILTALFIKNVGKKLFGDYPNKRKSHKKNIARVGGLAFGGIYIICCIINFQASSYFWLYTLGLIFIWLIGAMDDHKEKSWKTKLLFQMILGLLLFPHFIDLIEAKVFPVDSIFVPAVFVLYISIFLIILNSINLGDGLDGLVGGTSIIFIIGDIIIASYLENPLALKFSAILLATLLAFFLFNIFPAHCFMGDSGSLLLGFHWLSVPLILYSHTQTTITDIIIITLIPTYFYVDTIRVIMFRLMHKKSIVLPDKNHMHHIIFKKTNSVKTTTLSIYIYASLYVTICIYTLVSKSSKIAIILFIILIVIQVIFLPT